MRVPIDPKRRHALSAGKDASRNLAEMLAVDFPQLLRTLGLTISPEVAAQLGHLGYVRRMAHAAQLVQANLTFTQLIALRHHCSDTVRGWAAHATASDPAHGSVEDALHAMHDFAADPHFAVREWAWMALRPRLADNLPEALHALAPWVEDRDPNLRRFAIEALRPRGVWTQHIRALRQDPTPMRPLLEPLKCERHRYVQDSVANWLNDAGKDHPDFTSKLCDAWLQAHPDDKATVRICRRAQRRLTSR